MITFIIGLYLIYITFFTKKPDFTLKCGYSVLDKPPVKTSKNKFGIFGLLLVILTCIIVFVWNVIKFVIRLVNPDFGKRVVKN